MRKRYASVRRRLIQTMVFVGVPILILISFGFCTFSAPVYTGPVTDRFDGTKFLNQIPTVQEGMLRMLREEEGVSWHPYREVTPGSVPEKQVQDGRLRVTFINHATILIQMNGVNILTDPIWSDRASPVTFAGPRRVRPPGIRFADLPPIHAVVISHNHYDHLDLPTLHRLHEAHHPHFFTALGTGLLLEEEGLTPVSQLDWGQSEAIQNGVQIRAAPSRHFSGRGLCDQRRTQWASFIIKGDDGYVYFAGDTAYGPHFEQVRKTYGPPRVALIPIGAYRPGYFMEPVHLNPAQSVQAHLDLEANHSVAMHYGTFDLAYNGEEEPVETLHAAMADADVSEDDFWVLDFGEGRDVP